MAFSFSRALLGCPSQVVRLSSLPARRLRVVPPRWTITVSVRDPAQPPWPSSLSLSYRCASFSSTLPRASMSPATTTPPPPANPSQPDPQPPSVMTEEIFRGVQLGTLLYMKHGIGRQRLTELHQDQNVPLVIKWQRCMEAYLGVQVHVLAGLGYRPDETGIALYNQQLNAYLHQTNHVTPEIIEQVRTAQRDIWRLVLSTAFGIDLTTIVELPMDEARSIMHRVAQRMQDDDVLDEIAARCATMVVPSKLWTSWGGGPPFTCFPCHCRRLAFPMFVTHTHLHTDDNPQMEFVQRHSIVQETLVHKVYLGGSLLEECGFTPDEEGYIRLQLTMADHQNDPLVAQYIGTSMMKIVQVAGLADDVATMQQQATTKTDNPNVKMTMQPHRVIFQTPHIPHIHSFPTFTCI